MKCYEAQPTPPPEDDLDYAYCPTCDEIVEIDFEEPVPCITPTTEGRWAAGDIVCASCLGIIATLYVKLD